MEKELIIQDSLPGVSDEDVRSVIAKLATEVSLNREILGNAEYNPPEAQWHEQTAVPEGDGGYWPMTEQSVVKAPGTKRAPKETGDYSFEDRPYTIQVSENYTKLVCKLRSDVGPFLETTHAALESYYLRSKKSSSGLSTTKKTRKENLALGAITDFLECWHDRDKSPRYFVGVITLNSEAAAGHAVAAIAWRTSIEAPTRDGGKPVSMYDYIILDRQVVGSEAGDDDKGANKRQFKVDESLPDSANGYSNIYIEAEKIHCQVWNRVFKTAAGEAPEMHYQCVFTSVRSLPKEARTQRLLWAFVERIRQPDAPRQPYDTSGCVLWACLTLRWFLHDLPLKAVIVMKYPELQAIGKKQEKIKVVKPSESTIGHFRFVMNYELIKRKLLDIASMARVGHPAEEAAAEELRIVRVVADQLVERVTSKLIRHSELAQEIQLQKEETRIVLAREGAIVPENTAQVLDRLRLFTMMYLRQVVKNMGAWGTARPWRIPDLRVDWRLAVIAVNTALQKARGMLMDGSHNGGAMIERVNAVIEDVVNYVPPAGVVEQVEAEELRIVIRDRPALAVVPKPQVLTTNFDFDKAAAEQIAVYRDQMEKYYLGEDNQRYRERHRKFNEGTRAAKSHALIEARLKQQNPNADKDEIADRLTEHLYRYGHQRTREPLPMAALSSLGEMSLQELEAQFKAQREQRRRSRR